MSIRVKDRLRTMHLYDLADDGAYHELRVELDRLISEETGMPCDEGIDLLSDEQFKDALERAKEKIKKKKERAARSEGRYDRDVPLAGIA
ncbi:MAG: hypothetical protein ACE5KG_00075 [Nitrososphaerales archaeon]